MGRSSKHSSSSRRADLEDPPLRSPPPEAKVTRTEGVGRSAKRRPNCCVRLLRGLFVTFQLLFILVGLAVAFIGGYAFFLTTKDAQMAQLMPLYLTAGTLVLGVLMLSTSVFAIWCVGGHHRKMTFVYILLLLALIGLQVFALLQTEALSNAYLEALSPYWESLGEDARKAFQVTYSCCGFGGPDDKAASPCPDGVTQGCKTLASGMVDAFKANAMIGYGAMIGLEGLLILLAVIAVYAA